MSRLELLDDLKILNKQLEIDGFIIDGIFGSYARGENTAESDLDLLYHLNDTYYAKYSGLIGFKRLDEIKDIISKELSLKIDLAPINNLSQTGKKYILDEVVYVD